MAWLGLLAASGATPALGNGEARWLGGLAAAGAARWRLGPHAPRLVGPATGPALLAGAALLPASLAVIAAAGAGLGLSAGATHWPSHRFLDVGWLLVLAPVFEESLYRGPLISALRDRIGAVGAAVVSSALFALPHATPWASLGTFGVGLGLAALRLSGASLALCVAIHAGLNLGCLLRPTTLASSVPHLAAVTLAGATLLAAARRLDRRAEHRRWATDGSGASASAAP